MSADSACPACGSQGYYHEWTDMHCIVKAACCLATFEVKPGQPICQVTDKDGKDLKAKAEQAEVWKASHDTCQVRADCRCSHIATPQGTPCSAETCPLAKWAEIARRNLIQQQPPIPWRVVLMQEACPHNLWHTYDRSGFRLNAKWRGQPKTEATTMNRGHYVLCANCSRIEAVSTQP